MLARGVLRYTLQFLPSSTRRISSAVVCIACRAVGQLLRQVQVRVPLQSCLPVARRMDGQQRHQPRLQAAQPTHPPTFAALSFFSNWRLTTADCALVACTRAVAGQRCQAIEHVSMPNTMAPCSSIHRKPDEQTGGLPGKANSGAPWQRTCR